MNDYWQIISLINEILTIYGCETRLSPIDSDFRMNFPVEPYVIK